ncbi:hypothetical protein VPH35_055917 [Triticum aestivum]|uniref:Oligopeptidase A N-terminal domain-containing protein n=1 Tax=Triticum turgidum subsp. durum TaxID=4567 RepID=A0A9R1R010_TRITD|nr:unnamed protein product [Triticum turgidum subsp. durum]
MQEGELEELEKGVEPAWERLVHPLNCIVDRLNVVDHIKAVKDSPDLREEGPAVDSHRMRPQPPLDRCCWKRPWIATAAWRRSMRAWVEEEQGLERLGGGAAEEDGDGDLKSPPGWKDFATW